MFQLLIRHSYRVDAGSGADLGVWGGRYSTRIVAGQSVASDLERVSCGCIVAGQNVFFVCHASADP
jgi:hypothetical protein